MIWNCLCVGFFITIGVEIALGLCFAIGSAFKEVNKK